MLSIKGMEVIATAIGRNVDSPVADCPNKKKRPTALFRIADRFFVPGRGFEPLILRMKILRPRPTRRTRHECQNLTARKYTFFDMRRQIRKNIFSLLVFVLFEPESQTFTSPKEVRLLFQLEDIVHRDDLHILIIWHQKVKIQRVSDG